jgi:hypothetical protein
MRGIGLALAVSLGLLAAVTSAPDRAEALTLPAPAGVRAAFADSGPVQDAAYVCRRVWRCGYYACGWRRECQWVPSHRYYRNHYYRRW